MVLSIDQIRLQKGVLVSPSFGAVLPDDDCGSCRARQILCDAGLGMDLAFLVFFLKL